MIKGNKLHLLKNKKIICMILLLIIFGSLYYLSVQTKNIEGFNSSNLSTEEKLRKNINIYKEKLTNMKETNKTLNLDNENLKREIKTIENDNKIKKMIKRLE
jgi:hypothetical protein